MYGKANGQQRYLCKDCLTALSGGKRLDPNQLWDLYQSGLSYEQIGHQFGVSSSTIKRRLRGIQENYIAPKLSGGDTVPKKCVSPNNAIFVKL